MKRRGYGRRGYLAFILGMIVGFLLFLLISAVYSLRPIISILKPIPADTLEITFLYTSEKQSWIESVTPVFEKWVKDTLGLNVKVKLIVAGSHETVNLILHGSVKPTVWSPASSMWIPYLNSKWRTLGYNYDLALNGTPLVYSPTVIAVWKSFAERYNVTYLSDLYRIVEEGVEFRYGHPDPTLSNGGVAALLMEVAAAAGKPITMLSIEDLINPSIQEKVSSLERFAVKYGKSTGFFGRWAAESGPQAIQVFIVYENVVVDNSLVAKRKWGDPLIAVYPKDGVFMCDHPYVLLNAPWVSKEDKRIAELYLAFLLSDYSQREAMKHGFRPSVKHIQIDTSIFNLDNGVNSIIDAPIYTTIPSSDLLEGLIALWNKVRAGG